jgi:hypothetical protein
MAGDGSRKTARLVIYGRTIEDAGEGWKKLTMPCALACAERGFFVRSAGPLRVRLGEGRGRVLEVEGQRFVVLAGSGPRAPVAVLRKAEFMLLGIEPAFMDLEKLRAVPQAVDEQKLAAQDPLAVITYAHEQARRGNFLPIVTLGERGGKLPTQALADPRFRQEMAKRYELDAEALEGLDAKGLAAEWSRAEYPQFLLTLDIRVTRRQGDRADVVVERLAATSGLSLRRKDGRWVLGR